MNILQVVKHTHILPPQEELSLYHPKTIEKQEQQNMFYNQNFSKENECEEEFDIFGEYFDNKLYTVGEV